MTGEAAERRFLAMRRLQRARWAFGCTPSQDIPAVAWFALAIRLRAALGEDGSWREATAIGEVVRLRGVTPPSACALHVPVDLVKFLTSVVGQ